MVFLDEDNIWCYYKTSKFTKENSLKLNCKYNETPQTIHKHLAPCHYLWISYFVQNKHNLFGPWSWQHLIPCIPSSHDHPCYRCAPMASCLYFFILSSPFHLQVKSTMFTYLDMWSHLQIFGKWHHIQTSS